MRFLRGVGWVFLALEIPNFFVHLWYLHSPGWAVVDAANVVFLSIFLLLGPR